MKTAIILPNNALLRPPSFIYYFAYLFLLLSLLLAGCGGSQEEPATAEQVLVRQARPTFTATPSVAGVQPAVVDTPTAAQANTQSDSGQPQQPAANQSDAQAGAATLAPAQAAAGSKAILVITEEVVNARGGPGTNYPVVDFVGRGDQFDITGKSADNEWWQVCCVKNQQAWITQKFADADGEVDSVPVITSPSSAPVAQSQVQTAPTPTSPAIAAPVNAAPTATQPPPAPAAPAFAFTLQSQELFPDTNVVHIFLYVYGGNEALSGYSLRVAKNGVELPINAQPSGGPLPQLTWPIADQRQRLQNFKVEFPGEAPGGTWEVQLTQDGKPAGPIAKFQLTDNDPNRELYVRYQKQ